VSVVKPPFAYFGGKGVLAPRIAALLPAHGHYVEPYCGSLAVLLAKHPSGMETVNDLDGALLTFWRVLRERPADLARACALTPHSLAEFRDAEDVDAPADEVERARRVWVRLTQGRAGTLCSTGWRHFVDPSNSAFGMPGYLDAYVGRIAAAAGRLHRVSLECRPALEVIAWYGRSPDVLLYVDPPYLRSTRSSGAYRHEMTEQDHRDLAAALRGAKASVVLSGYASDLYDLDLYAGWRRTEFRSGTGQNAETWGNRTEVLWSNRPFSQGSLFDGLEDGEAS
jgi:DNA adenine methylase